MLGQLKDSLLPAGDRWNLALPSHFLFGFGLFGIALFLLSLSRCALFFRRAAGCPNFALLGAAGAGRRPAPESENGVVKPHQTRRACRSLLVILEDRFTGWRNFKRKRSSLVAFVLFQLYVHASLHIYKAFFRVFSDIFRFFRRPEIIIINIHVPLRIAHFDQCETRSETPRKFRQKARANEGDVASNARACLSGLFCLSVEACWACFPTDSTLIEPPY